MQGLVVSFQAISSIKPGHSPMNVSPESSLINSKNYRDAVRHRRFTAGLPGYGVGTTDALRVALIIL
jgi:hypothetical protein